MDQAVGMGDEVCVNGWWDIVDGKWRKANGFDIGSWLGFVLGVGQGGGRGRNYLRVSGRSCRIARLGITDSALEVAREKHEKGC